MLQNNTIAYIGILNNQFVHELLRKQQNAPKEWYLFLYILYQYKMKFSPWTIWIFL